jgi:hypothetical protein
MKTKTIVILFILFVGLVLMSYYGTKLREGVGGMTDAENQAEAERKSAEAAQVRNKDDLAKLNASRSNSSGSRSGSRSGSSSSYETRNSGSEIIQSGTSLYGPNGEICQVLVDENNKQYLEVRNSITQSPVYYNYDLTATDKYTGPNGSYAEVYIGVDNQPRISITDATGNTKIFSVDGTHANSNNGRVSNSNYNPVVDMGFTGSPMGSNNYNSVYSSSLPTGIPASQIVPGTEDLYILKSQVVPPVCPACAATKAPQQSSSTCPPCPACARCPEPAFECKKVPNYKSIDNQYLPFPVLNDFTSFGM